MSGKGGKGFSVARGKIALKSPVSKSATLKGKDNVAPKKGRRVQFEASDSGSEDSVEEIPGGSLKAGGKDSFETSKTGKKVSFESLKSGGKASFETPKIGKKVSIESLKLGGKASFETPAGKGDWGKGGKHDTTGKAGGKGSIPRPVPKILKEVELKLEAELPKNAKILKDCEVAPILLGIQEYLPALSEDPMMKMPESFNKALQYVKTVDHYKNPKSVGQALDKLKEIGATDGEICMIANVCPETTEEVYALIPSLKDNKSKNEGPIRDALADLAKHKHSK